MKDLSLHLLDLAMNSIRAHATFIEIELMELEEKNLLIIHLKDNGDGMSEETVTQVKSPFFTTRSTRKVGLGLSLLSAMATHCRGDVYISSKLGEGTTVTLKVQLNHMDRPPFGDIHSTIRSLIYLEPTIDFKYYHQRNDEHYEFETRQVRKVIGKLPINYPSVMEWIQNELKMGDLSFTSY